MSGRPVWLASITKRTGTGQIVPAYKLSALAIREGQGVLQRVLAGVGDPERERLFAMCITLCMHRALSDAEIAGLPESWHTAPALDLAGGPVKVISSRGIARIPSVEPCENLTRDYSMPLGLDWQGERLWVPKDCGGCDPCRARLAAVCSATGKKPRGHAS